MPNKPMEQYYRARAGEYEKIYYRPDPARQAELAAERKRLAALVSDCRVLELACGTGYWTRVMSETAMEISATDLSSEMLHEARQKDFNCPVNFEQADLSALPLKEPEYDIVALGFWFSHQPRQDYDSFFEAICRLLLPTGRIWMIDNNPPAEGPETHTVRVDEHGNNFKKRWLDNGAEHVILKNYFSEKALREILSDRFDIEQVDFGKHYWSVVLALRNRN